MVVAWLVFPLLLTAISLGLGFLANGLSGGRVPATLLLPVGFGGLVVLTGFTTNWAATSTLTTPIVLLSAGFGLIAFRSLRSRGVDTSLTAAAVGVYAVYAAPALLTGSTTFAGFIKLDDGAQWMAMADRLVDGGRSALGMSPSTHEATVAVNMAPPYPVGAFPPMSVGAQALGTDPMWLMQPYMAWLGALLAVTLAGMLASMVPRPGPRAWAVFIAAQPALLLGFSLWGAVKESALAPLVALVAVLVTSVGRVDDRRLTWIRALIPLAVALGAVVLVAGVSGGWWVVIPMLWLAIQWVHGNGWRRGVARVGVVGAMALVMALPNLVWIQWSAIRGLATYASVDVLGNLWGRLSMLQVVGIWPTGDFRGQPSHMLVTILMVALVVGAAAFGIFRSARAARWEVPLYVLTTVPLAVIVNTGSQWVGSKGLAVASPALLTAASVGLAGLAARGWRVEAALGAAVVSTGVLWSSALAYHEAWLAPHEALADLRNLAEVQGLEGPALILEYNSYASRHLFRDLDAQGASEIRRDLIPTYSGRGLESGEYSDIDDFPMSSLAKFNTLVLRRSVQTSRPPADWSLVRSGPVYEVWAREAGPGATTVIEHLPLGDRIDPGGIADCKAVTDLAGRAPAGSQLAFVPRPPVLRAEPVVASAPPDWTVSSTGQVAAPSSGTMTYTVDLPVPGTYQPFVKGSFRGRLRVSLDGTPVFDQRHLLMWEGGGSVGTPIRMDEGVHTIDVTYSGPDWHPGSAGFTFAFGPILLSQQTAETSYRTLARERADELCGKRLDWVAVIGG